MPGRTPEEMAEDIMNESDETIDALIHDTERYDDDDNDIDDDDYGELDFDDGSQDYVGGGDSYY